MAWITLSGITGCVSPASGETASVAYGTKYNTDKIVSYYKRDVGPTSNNSFTAQYIVVVVFENYTQNFIFHDSGDRDTFYGTLPS